MGIMYELRVREKISLFCACLVLCEYVNMIIVCVVRGYYTYVNVCEYKYRCMCLFVCGGGGGCFLMGITYELRVREFLLCFVCIYIYICVCVCVVVRVLCVAFRGGGVFGCLYRI
jgi:hypothetical protein